MAKIVHANRSGSRPGTCEQISGKAKLERLKALVFPPESKPERVARALDALQKAIKKSPLDIEMIKCLAEDVDLEGF